MTSTIFEGPASSEAFHDLLASLVTDGDDYVTLSDLLGTMPAGMRRVMLHGLVLALSLDNVPPTLRETSKLIIDPLLVTFDAYCTKEDGERYSEWSSAALGCITAQFLRGDATKMDGTPVHIEGDTRQEVRAFVGTLNPEDIPDLLAAMKEAGL